jgi:eukaryotic-like serine/threonine-protein kinase
VRRFFQIVSLAFVLLGVALISALMAMQLAIHGREVTIPSLGGMTLTEAERASTAAGLQIVVERQFYSPTVPEGRIMAQTPPPATKVRRGWQIRVAQSLGPQRVAIPDVTGSSERAAELNIRRRALTLGSVAEVALPDTQQDQVVAQNPPANASGISVPEINLLVSLGPEPAAYVMPNLIGQPLGSATLALQEAGMRVGKVSEVVASPPPDSQAAPTVPSEPNAASMIVTQTPAPGQKILAGSTANFEVR